MNFGEKWNNIVFSDEKKFNLDGPDGISNYWHDLRREKHFLSKRVHSGGSVMIWAGFSSKGKTNLAIISSKMNAFDYQGVLGNYLLPEIANLSGDQRGFNKIMLHVTELYRQKTG